MGAQQSSASSPSSASPSSASPSSASSSSPLSLSSTPSPSALCEFSKKQIQKFEKEIEQLNISRDQKIGLHSDFKTQLADANTALKRIPASDNDIQFVANVGKFNDKNTILQDATIVQYPLIVKYILCCEVVHILTAYKSGLKKIVELCTTCQTKRDVDNVDQNIDEAMTIFEMAESSFVLFSQNYTKGDISGDEYGTLLFDALVKSTNSMHDMFINKEKVKRIMREICKNREELKGAMAVLFNKGGKKFSMSKRKFKSKKQKLSRKKNKKVKRGKK